MTISREGDSIVARSEAGEDTGVKVEFSISATGTLGLKDVSGNENCPLKCHTFPKQSRRIQLEYIRRKKGHRDPREKHGFWAIFTQPHQFCVVLRVFGPFLP